MNVDVIIECNNDELLPKYETSGASGMDLKAAIESSIKIKSLERVLVPTGIKIAIPLGYEAQVRSRSGRAIKEGLMCLNSPGTIDSDYRGEIKVILFNASNIDIEIKPNERIAQLVFAPITIVNLINGNMDETERGAGGFGHTGK